MSIVLGLLGFGIVVFVHELGHFIAAKLAGVEVEAFSLGWGPRLVGFKLGGTDYRLSVLPIGGFCKMKGEDSVRGTSGQGNAIPVPEKGSFNAASPWRRIAISLAGPLFNLIFAFLVFVAVFGSGYTVRTFENRILLASDLDGERASGPYPAQLAGLKSGDRIVAIDGKPVDYFAQIQEAVSLAPEKTLRLSVERDGSALSLLAKPELDSSSAAGKLGVYPLADTVVDEVEAGGAADIAGLKVGDRIVEAGGMQLPHLQALSSALASHPERFPLVVERDGARVELQLVLVWADDGSTDLGLVAGTVDWKVRADSAADAVARGAAETAKIFGATLRGLGSLFGNKVDPLKAVSGPARITFMVGETALRGFEGGFGAGISVVFSFLSLLSIGLFIMNLLPIPVLDGGMIVLCIVELIRGKPPKPKTVYWYQTIGMIAILGIFLLSTIADLLFFSGR